MRVRVCGGFYSNFELNVMSAILKNEIHHSGYHLIFELKKRKEKVELRYIPTFSRNKQKSKLTRGEQIEMKTSLFLYGLGIFVWPGHAIRVEFNI